MTSSAEQKLPDTGQLQNDNEEGVKTLEAEIQPFYFFKQIDAHIGERTLKERMGVTLVLGGRKTDQLDQLDGRLYAGYRAAFNPNTYFDALIGKTQSLDSLRMELRGQMPIFRLANGSRFYIGGIINAAIRDRKKMEEADVVRAYVKWDSPDLSKMF